MIIIMTPSHCGRLGRFQIKLGSDSEIMIMIMIMTRIMVLEPFPVPS